MKKFNILIALALVFSVTSLMAQKVPALKLQNNTFLTASTNSTPLVRPVQLSELLDAYQLNIIDENTMIIENGISVISFTMTAISNRGNKTFPVKGNEITQDMKQQWQTLNAGDKVYFEYIIGQAADGSSIKMKAMAFKVL